MKPLHTLGKYELIEKIGSGGMAEVYRARLTGIEGFEKIVVVKRILPGYARDLSFIKMLVEEAKLTSVLQHPNIVQIFELDSLENQFYIAMEYVDGKDLLKILARCAERKIPFPPEIAAFVAAEACKGLHYAHNAKDMYGNPLNIIHRDVSPSNVIVSWDGHVKLMDFGVAKARTQDQKGSKHVLRGKLGYMSPEQVRGEEVDHRSDIFSLGIVVFESLTLKRLFLGRTDLETLINIRDADVEKKFRKYAFLDEGMRRILRKALARDRDERYVTALDMHNDLMDYLFAQGVRTDSAKVAGFLRLCFREELEGRPVAPSASQDAVRVALEGGVAADERQKTFVGRPATAPSIVRPPAPETAAGEPPYGRTPTPEPAPSDAATPIVQDDDDTALADLAPPEAALAPRVPAAIPPAEPAAAPAEPTPARASPTPRPKPQRTRHREPTPAPIERPSEVPFEEEESSPKVGQEPPPVGTRLRGHDFNLRNTAGFVFGPVSYENLVNLVQTGSVSEEEFVSIDGGAWKKVKEVTQIRTLSPNEAMRIKGIAPTYSGIVSRVAIPKIFYQVASRQISGKLRFSSGSSQKEFYFSRGKPKHIASNLKQELLGPFLLHRGVVNNDQMSQALRKSGDFGGRVGDALVSLGFVRPHELYFLLDEQFKEKLIQVFEWQQGSYEFYDRAPCPVEMAPSDVNVYRYILEGVRRYLKLPELTPFLATHEQNVIRERKNLFLAVDHLPLNSREQRLWGLVQRKPVLQAVRDEFCAREEDRLSLYQLLLVLFQLDLIEFVRKK